MTVVALGPAAGGGRTDTTTLGSDGSLRASVLLPHLERLDRYSRAAGLRRSLREFGIARSALAEVAQRIHAEPGLSFNPRPIESAAQIEAMLQQAW